MYFVLQEHAPCVLFVDEVDAICPKRETAHREMERRIVTQLLASLDGEHIDLAQSSTCMSRIGGGFALATPCWIPICV